MRLYGLRVLVGWNRLVNQHIYQCYTSLFTSSFTSFWRCKTPDPAWSPDNRQRNAETTGLAAVIITQ